MKQQPQQTEIVESENQITHDVNWVNEPAPATIADFYKRVKSNFKIAIYDESTVGKFGATTPKARFQTIERAELINFCNHYPNRAISEVVEIDSIEVNPFILPNN